MNDRSWYVRSRSGDDAEILFDIWLKSVRATHIFLSEEDITHYARLVREYLESNDAEIWVLCSDADAVLGFMGLSPNKIEALFIDPAFQRRGGGRRLVRHAEAIYSDLTVDVNEQNPAACRFYQSCGFVVEGRSELDSTGRPFPILHLRLADPRPPISSTALRFR